MRVARIRIEVDGFRCERCEHEWVPRGVEEPSVCPACKSPYWNRPRRRTIYRTVSLLKPRRGASPDDATIARLKRQLTGLGQVRENPGSPDAVRAGDAIRITLDLQAMSPGNAELSARSFVAGRARALGLLARGHSTDIRVTVIPR